MKGYLQGLHESGGLTAERVVDLARPADHPLHVRFEWDDSIAAEMYRREQARELIRSVKIKYAEDAEGRDKEVRAFVSTRDPKSPEVTAYRPTEEVLADPIAQKMLLRDCRREWMAFRRKYDHLQEFAQIIAGTDQATG